MGCLKKNGIDTCTCWCNKKRTDRLLRRRIKESMVQKGSYMNNDIAQRLAEMRRSRGYSQEELAWKLGLSRQAISKWERAESSPDTGNLLALSRLYGVTLDELVCGSDADTERHSVEESTAVVVPAETPAPEPVGTPVPIAMPAETVSEPVPATTPVSAPASVVTEPAPTVWRLSQWLRLRQCPRLHLRLELPLRWRPRQRLHLRLELHLRWRPHRSSEVRGRRFLIPLPARLLIWLSAFVLVGGIQHGLSSSRFRFITGS